MRLRAAVLFSALLALASADCNSGCERYCESETAAFDDCLAKCSAACVAPHHVEDPYFQLVEVKNLYQDYPITGCDGYREPPFTQLFCTSKNGRVYRLNTTSNQMTVIHSMPVQRLFTRDGCGLYDIFFDADFPANRHIYLYHAMQDVREDVHHINVISMYRMNDVFELQFLQVVRVFVQHEPTLHAWAKQDMRQYISSGPAPVLASNPGNPDNNFRLRRTMPHLSAISAFFVNQTEAVRELMFASAINEYTWAKGLSNPVTCDRTRYLAENVMCLSRNGEQTLVYNAHRTRDYTCKGKLCEDKIFANLTDGGCPVEYMVYFTGSGSLLPTRLFSRTACYRDGEFHPAQILKLYEPKVERLWSSISVPTSMSDGSSLALTNTTLLYSDRFNRLYFGGYSLRDNNYYVYQMQRLKKLY